MRFPLVLLFALCCMPAFAQDAEKEPPLVASSDDPDAAETAPSKVPLDEIRRYVAVYNAVKDAYVEPVDDKKLMHSAIRGLLLDLDPHSTYFDKEDAEAFDEQATGAYDGVGVELLQQPDNTLRVIAPIDGTPAAKAGIKSGDVIVAIDGKPISNEDGMEPLRGEPGSKLTLTIAREGKPKPFMPRDEKKVEKKEAAPAAPQLKESTEENSVVLVSDVDMLTDNAAVEATMPFEPMPASVKPRCRAWSERSDSIE